MKNLLQENTYAWFQLNAMNFYLQIQSWCQDPIFREGILYYQ